MKKLSLEMRVRRLESLLYNENTSMTNLDCERLKKVIDLNLKRYDCTADMADDNSDYGFVNVGIYDANDEFVTDYDIVVADYNKFEILHDDKKFSTADSYNNVGKAIAKHYGENFG